MFLFSLRGLFCNDITCKNTFQHTEWKQGVLDAVSLIALLWRSPLCSDCPTASTHLLTCLTLRLTRCVCGQVKSNVLHINSQITFTEVKDRSKTSLHGTVQDLWVCISTYSLSYYTIRMRENNNKLNAICPLYLSLKYRQNNHNRKSRKSNKLLAILQRIVRYWFIL